MSTTRGGVAFLYGKSDPWGEKPTFKPIATAKSWPAMKGTGLRVGDQNAKKEGGDGSRPAST